MPKIIAVLVVYLGFIAGYTCQVDWAVFYFYNYFLTVDLLIQDIRLTL